MLLRSTTPKESLVVPSITSIRNFARVFWAQLMLCTPKIHYLSTEANGSGFALGEGTF